MGSSVAAKCLFNHYIGFLHCQLVPTSDVQNAMESINACMDAVQEEGLSACSVLAVPVLCSTNGQDNTCKYSKLRISKTCTVPVMYVKLVGPVGHAGTTAEDCAGPRNTERCSCAWRAFLSNRCHVQGPGGRHCRHGHRGGVLD